MLRFDGRIAGLRPPKPSCFKVYRYQRKVQWKVLRFVLRQSLLALTLVCFTGPVQGADLFGYSLNTGANPNGLINAAVV